MNTSHLIGEPVEIKVSGLNSAVSGVILGVEPAGLWIHKGDVLERIAVNRGDDFPAVPSDPAIFVPFATISWMMTSRKESAYQKAR
jgi:hypothetical protein